MTKGNVAPSVEVVKVPKRLLTVREAAEYLSCGVSSLRELVWGGEIPEIRFNRRVLLDIRDLDQFVNRIKRNALES